MTDTLFPGLAAACALQWAGDARTAERQYHG